MNGDGECQEGQVWEAAMTATARGLDNVCAIVNVNRIQLDGTVDSVKSLGDLPAKWRAFGWNILDVDGHDLRAVDEALTEAARATGAPHHDHLPHRQGQGCVLHGEHRQVPRARPRGRGAHHCSGGTAMTRLQELREPRAGYAEGLLELGAEHDDVFVLDGDCAKSNYTDRFGQKFPDRFFNIGIAECDIVGTTAGMAAMGRVPFANAYGNFLTGRGLDQVRVSVARSERNVKIVGHNAGTSAAQEGATHLPLEDVGLMRGLPGMTVVVPCDAVEMRKEVHAVHALDGPVYLRVGKLPVPVVTDEDTPFEIGRAVRLREGGDVTVLTTGCTAAEALGAADLLAGEGVEADVLHLHTVKPLDVEAVVASTRRTGCVVTVEEHSVINGLGSAVAEALGEQRPVPLERVGTRDVFGVSGTMDELFDHFGLRAADIARAARTVLGRRD